MDQPNMRKWFGGYEFLAQHPWGWTWRRMIVYAGAMAVGWAVFGAVVFLVWLTT